MKTPIVPVQDYSRAVSKVLVGFDELLAARPLDVSCVSQPRFPELRSSSVLLRYPVQR